MLRENVNAGGDTVWLVTITAPGVDRLPWCSIQDGVVVPVSRDEAAACRASGVAVRVDPAAAAEWNRTAQRRWSELHRRACQTVRRAGLKLTTIAGVWQLQERGVLHRHVVLDRSTLAARVAARTYVGELRRLAREFEFGYVDARDRGRGSTVMPSGAASAYLSKYLGSSQLSEAVALPERPVRLVWVSPRITSRTGCTMRRLRRVRYLWWIRRGSRIVEHAGRYPEWFRDAAEHAAVCRLARAP